VWIGKNKHRHINLKKGGFDKPLFFDHAFCFQFELTKSSFIGSWVTAVESPALYEPVAQIYLQKEF